MNTHVLTTPLHHSCSDVLVLSVPLPRSFATKFHTILSVNTAVCIPNRKL